MSGFKFNFGKFGKPKINKSGNLPRREIIQKNVIAVIGIDLNGQYYADLNGTNYNLTIESYEVKGKNVYYSRKLQNDKTLMIISLKKLNHNNNNVYLPFTVGSIVKGNTYKILGIERFNISKILELKDVPENNINYYRNLSIKYKKFYKEHQKEIDGE